MKLCSTLLGLAFCAGFAVPTKAQSNTIPGTDVALGFLSSLEFQARTGVFPNGVNGLAMSTTSCNEGSVEVPWLSPMDEDHPFISFLMVREDDVRIVQISDYSHVKHGFFALADSQCTPCQGGDPFGGSFLGIGCSDTYATQNNGNSFWLGPAEEIDPWLGEWDATCSLFDAGSPSVGGGAACDGNRSFSQTQVNNLPQPKFRMLVRDADLQPSNGETYHYQSQYTVRGEPESVRENNLGSRTVVPNWTGFLWNFSHTASLREGSVLERWDGSDLNSNTNGTDDGRVYVAVKVTGPVEGIYHYEYAVHNRDNSRGIDEFKLPTCTDARVFNVGFRDIDQSSGNDWGFSRGTTEMSWSTGSNPLRWNSIYNFWFDSDAAPESGSVVLGQFTAGPGAGSFGVSSSAPLGNYNVYTGDGCSFGSAPSLYGDGTPARATIGNSSFEVASAGNAPGTISILAYSPFSASIPLGGGCTSLVSSTGLRLRFKTVNGSGIANWPFPVPNDGSLEGLELYMQALEFELGGGPAFSDYDLTNGLRVRVGDAISSCP